jgi:hypothetical protein
MKIRSHTTQRRSRDTPPHYKPYSPRHTEEPIGTVMGTWISKEPQSPNPRDSFEAVPRPYAEPHVIDGLRTLQPGHENSLASGLFQGCDLQGRGLVVR